MEIHLSSEQFILLIEALGKQLDETPVKHNAALFRLYLRVLLQAQDQGIDITELKI